MNTKHRNNMQPWHHSKTLTTWLITTMTLISTFRSLTSPVEYISVQLTVVTCWFLRPRHSSHFLEIVANTPAFLLRKNSEEAQFPYFAYGSDSWWAKMGRYYTEWDEIRWRVQQVKRSRDGRISDPAIRIRPDFYYPAKSDSGRIACFTPDRIGANFCVNLSQTLCRCSRLICCLCRVVSKL